MTIKELPFITVEQVERLLNEAIKIEAERDTLKKTVDALYEEWPCGLDEIESAMRTSRGRMLHRDLLLDALKSCIEHMEFSTPKGRAARDAAVSIVSLVERDQFPTQQMGRILRTKADPALVLDFDPSKKLPRATEWTLEKSAEKKAMPFSVESQEGGAQ